MAGSSELQCLGLGLLRITGEPPASLEVRCLAAFQLVGELSAVRCKLIHNGVELIAADAPEASAPGAAIDDADVMGLKYVDDSVLLHGRLSERRHIRGRPQNTRC